jgi:hypothetical protein
MTWTPPLQSHTSSLKELFQQYQATAASIAGHEPEDDLATFGAFLIARDVLFQRLAIPVTAHNSLRLYDTALADEDLDDFLLDADHFFPSAIVRDEALFLSALATYFGWRSVHELDARVYDIEAFLDVQHHRHNTAVVTAWLAGTLGYSHVHSHVSADGTWLEHAIC